MKSLKRIQVGDFKINDAVDLNYNFENNKNNNLNSNSENKENNNLNCISNNLNLENKKSNIKKDEKIKNHIKEKSNIKENEKLRGYIEKHLISIEEFFKNAESIKLNDYKLNLFLNGVQLTVNSNYLVDCKNSNNSKNKLQDKTYKIYNEQNKFIGTGTIKNGLLKREIVL